MGYVIMGCYMSYILLSRNPQWMFPCQFPATRIVISGISDYHQWITSQWLMIWAIELFPAVVVSNYVFLRKINIKIHNNKPLRVHLQPLYWMKACPKHDMTIVLVLYGFFRWFLLLIIYEWILLSSSTSLERETPKWARNVNHIEILF